MTGRWWRKTELETERELEPAELGGADADRLEQAFSSELTSSMSLNIRGTGIAAVSAIAVLMLAQFSATWLDDNRWHVPDIWDVGLLWLLPATVAAFGLASMLAGVAIWPKRRWADEQRNRMEDLAAGQEAASAARLLRMVERQRQVNERRSRLLRIAAICFAAALLGTIVQGMIFAFKAEPVDAAGSGGQDTPDVDPNTLPSADEQLRLARQFAPRVWLHPDEQFGPVDPAVFVRASRLEWRLRRGSASVEARGRVSANRLGAACDRAPGGCYEHAGYLARQLTRPFTDKRGRPSGLNVRRGLFLDVVDSERRGQARRDPDAPVFFEFRRTPDELLVTYWFFYGFSRPHVVLGLRGADALRDQLSHEGDWENVDVALTPDARTAVALYLYGHGTPSRVRWNQVCTSGDEPTDCRLGASGHPVVYSALDSHASYSARGQVKVCNSIGCALDLSAQGFRWDTWGRDDGLRPVRQEPWFGFGGAWGVAGPIGDRTGPLGPSRWKLPADPDPGDLARVPD